MMKRINCHRVKQALSQANQRSIEESLVRILINLCNLYQGEIIHLESLAANLLIIVAKVHACFDKECGQSLKNAGKLMDA